MVQVDLRLGDCLEVMAGIPAGSIDAIIADLPYGTTACKWDSVIPFEPLWEHYKRLIKPRGAIVLFGSQPFTSALVMSNPAWFRHRWVWHKSRPTNFAHAKRMPLRDCEDILVFARQSPQYNPQGLVRVDRIVKNGGTKSTTRGGMTKANGETSSAALNSKRTMYWQEFTNYPREVLVFSNHTDALHPTQKPVALLEYLVRTYTNKGETVLDNTMGSGTCGVACVNTGRSFIGIERDAGYFKIAQERIQKAQQEARQLDLPLEAAS